MFVKEIELNNFRLLENTKLSFSKKITILYGLNGQGKTSFLEAIYLLSHAKSFRTAKTKDLLSWRLGTEQDVALKIGGRIETQDGDKLLSFSLHNGQKVLSINNNNVQRFADFYGQLAIVAITPDDEEIITGQAATRRKFIDQLIASVSPVYIDNLLSYQRAVKNKNALLRSYKSLSLGEQEEFKKQILVWNSSIIEHGLIIAKLRRHYVERLKPHFQRYHNFLIQGEIIEKTEIEYESRFIKEGELLSIKDLEQSFDKYYLREIKLQSSLMGVHRDDLNFVINCGNGDNIARTAASKGQVKTFILALKLACCEIIKEENQNKEPPILLLDDIESELDEQRKASFFTLFSDLSSQIFIATTSKTPFLNGISEALEMNVYQGKITHQNNL
ncbi:MAG: DNA replication and repair protein RecF [Deltaproteobacteria bacterium]|nr:DNA replication and repair protein RecF [Deltaproteobacteria bacterium]